VSRNSVSIKCIQNFIDPLHFPQHSGVYLDVRVNQSGLNTEAAGSSETSILAYKPTRCPNRDDYHLETYKFIVTLAFKNFCAMCGSLSSVTVSTRCQWHLSWATWLCFTLPCTISVRSILISASCLQADILQFFAFPIYPLGPGVAQWLRRCAASRTVLGSISGGVTGFFSDIFLPTVPWP
jgi:hypothetical protein